MFRSEKRGGHRIDAGTRPLRRCRSTGTKTLAILSLLPVCGTDRERDEDRNDDMLLADHVIDPPKARHGNRGVGALVNMTFTGQVKSATAGPNGVVRQPSNSSTCPKLKAWSSIYS